MLTQLLFMFHIEAFLKITFNLFHSTSISFITPMFVHDKSKPRSIDAFDPGMLKLIATISNRFGTMPLLQTERK